MSRTDGEEEGTPTRPQIEPGQVDLGRYAVFDDCHMKEVVVKRRAQKNSRERSSAMASSESGIEFGSEETDEDADDMEMEDKGDGIDSEDMTDTLD